MSILIIVDNPKKWNLSIPTAEVISAKSYLIDENRVYERGTMVFNLCKSYKYQTMGYYVSLLAAARMHKTIPPISAILDLKSQAVIDIASDELDDLIQSHFRHLHAEEFVLSIYFGKNFDKKYDRLALKIFSYFQTPFIRAYFKLDKNNHKWSLDDVEVITIKDIPESHQDLVLEGLKTYISRGKSSLHHRKAHPYELAILADSSEPSPPSNPKAMEKFRKAAEKTGFNVTMVDHNDYHKIPMFDALFIRETTGVNHLSFKFAQYAQAEGLFVIDDPESIIRCGNKVYLTEILLRNRLPIPRTVIVDKDSVEEIESRIGFPCILKQPDSAFSMGVMKIESKAELDGVIPQLLKKSDLLLAQEFMPTGFDWRVGILNRQVIFVCKYYMAKKHWQIMNWNTRKDREGATEPVYIGDAPKALLNIALKAANLIGNGLYGVDIKQIEDKFYIIEINDNPNIDHGNEDAKLKDDLYGIIMKHFFDNVLKIKGIGVSHE